MAAPEPVSDIAEYPDEYAMCRTRLHAWADAGAVMKMERGVKYIRETERCTRCRGERDRMVPLLRPDLPIRVTARRQAKGYQVDMPAMGGVVAFRRALNVSIALSKIRRR